MSLQCTAGGSCSGRKRKTGARAAAGKPPHRPHWPRQCNGVLRAGQGRWGAASDWWHRPREISGGPANTHWGHGLPDVLPNEVVALPVIHYKHPFVSRPPALETLVTGSAVWGGGQSFGSNNVEPECR